MDLLVVGDAVLACGSRIPGIFQRAVPARSLGQIFQVRIVVTYFWSSLFVRFLSSNDSPTSVSSPELFDSAVVGSAIGDDVSPAGFSGGDDDISDLFSVDSISDIDQGSTDKERNVKEINVNIKQGTGNIEQSGNVEHSCSNEVESMINDKDIEQSMNNGKDFEQSMNNGKDIEQNTVILEQSTSNIEQSSIKYAQQSINVGNNNSDKSSSNRIEQNIEVVNDNSDECSIVNVVADSQPVESLSSEDPPSWAEVVAMEEALTLTAPACPFHGTCPGTESPFSSSFRSF